MRLAQYMDMEDLIDETVAEALGCSRPSVTRYRQGKQNPSLPMMAKIRDYTEGRVMPNDWLESS